MHKTTFAAKPCRVAIGWKGTAESRFFGNRVYGCRRCEMKLSLLHKTSSILFFGISGNNAVRLMKLTEDGAMRLRFRMALKAGRARVRDHVLCLVVAPEPLEAPSSGVLVEG